MLGTVAKVLNAVQTIYVVGAAVDLINVLAHKRLLLIRSQILRHHVSLQNLMFSCKGSIYWAGACELQCEIMRNFFKVANLRI